MELPPGGVNLANFYREGEKGIISPRPEQEIEVYRYGAEKGYPDYLFYYANELYGQGKRKRLSSSTAGQRTWESPGPSSGQGTPMSWVREWIKTPPGLHNTISRR